MVSRFVSSSWQQFKCLNYCGMWMVQVSPKTDPPWAVDGHRMLCSIISFCQSAVTAKVIKRYWARLGSNTAITLAFTFIFTNLLSLKTVFTVILIDFNFLETTMQSVKCRIMSSCYRFSKYWPSNVFGSHLDLSRSCDVIGHVTVQLGMDHFLGVFHWYWHSIDLQRISRYWGSNYRYMLQLWKWWSTDKNMIGDKNS